MPLALWEPPIDPGQLVAAVASGLSLSSALNDLNASLPNYRFAWLLSRALDATAELKGLESTFLSIKEKRDGEALQLLRTGHEITMNNMIMELKKSSLEEAERTLTALRASQEVSSLPIYCPGCVKGKPTKPKSAAVIEASLRLLLASGWPRNKCLGQRQ
jgi:hypothetical protein